MTIRTDFEAWAKPWAFRLEQDGEDYANEHTDHAWMGFQAAHALYAPRWIRVASQPPATNERVRIAYIARDGGYAATVAVFSSGLFYSLDGQNLYRNVVYWMPLPSTEGLE